MVEIGNHVTFVNSIREEHNALVTNVWSQTCINLVYVEDDEKQTDSYGRKIARFASVSHESLQNHGNYWK